MEKELYTYEGKKYALVKVTGTDECEVCALNKECGALSVTICQDVIGIPREKTSHHVLEEITDDDKLTEQRAFDDYQGRSKMVSDKADMLAWAYILILTGQLIGNSKYAEFYIAAAGGVIYLLLAIAQYLWQTVGMWLTMCRIKSKGVSSDDYPNWVGGGAWVFYYAKLAVITVTTLYFATHLISLL